MTPRIQRAIDTLLDAINKGTLAKGTCTACAVGNLVAKGMDAEIIYDRLDFSCNKPNDCWGRLFCTTGEKQRFASELTNNPTIITNIKSTEFSLDELRKIEYAFETNTKIYWISYPGCTKEQIRADQIRGLEAVVKVMLGFDEQPDDVKEVFTKKAELVPL